MISIRLIEVYQKTISPDHSRIGNSIFPSGYCKYYPSCSEYTKRAILKYGFLKGWMKGLYRILRCNPFTKGGIDIP